MLYKKKIFVIIFFLLICKISAGQIKDSATTKRDSITIAQNIKKDSSTKNILAADTSAKKFNPRIATLRSALIPGWGQAYNKKYWKIPIVYGALGTTAAIFFYNLKTYKQLKKAFIYRSDTIPSNDALINPQFSNLTSESIRSYRNTFRQNVDYSALFFIVFWGINVVDATVDAHLKAFDVSDDISLKIKPGYNPYTNSAGISLVFNFKDKHTSSNTFSIP